jgi:transcriptional regulator with XRE-family HTH domain
MSEGSAIRLAIGNALRNRRVEGGLSLAALAERADLSTGHLSDVERGVKEISTDRLARACAALDMPPAELFAQVSVDLAEPTRISPRPAPRARLVQSAERLSPAALRTVAEFSAYMASKEAGGRRRRIGFEF